MVPNVPSQKDDAQEHGQTSTSISTSVHAWIVISALYVQQQHCQAQVAPKNTRPLIAHDTPTAFGEG